MQVVAEAVSLGSTLDLPRDLLFETLAKTAVVAPAHIGKLASAAIPGVRLRTRRICRWRDGALNGE
jgi:hypothetical protein